MPFQCQQEQGNKKSNVSHNSCVAHLRSLVDKKGDTVSYDIVFDLPFSASPHLASDILGGNHDPDAIPVVKAYVGSPGQEQQAAPSDFIHTLVLLFQKVDDGFSAKKSVTVKEFAAESSDDSFEWA